MGIVGDVRQYGLDREPADEIYLPLAQAGFGGNLLVRTASDPMSIAISCARRCTRLIRTPQSIEFKLLSRFAATRGVASADRDSLAMFAGLALVITAAGIAGVMAFR